MVSLEEAYSYVKSQLKDGRYIHTLGVISVAKKLAEINDYSVEKAEIAALCHDIAKNIPKNEMLMLFEKYNIVLSQEEKSTKSLWHSILAPHIAREKLGIDDEEILSAIRWHTTGKSDMSLLDKIIYIADMIEPSRDFDGVKEIRKITLKNLDKGVLAGINHTIKYLLEDDKLLDINTIEARNYLLLNK